MVQLRGRYPDQNATVHFHSSVNRGSAVWRDMLAMLRLARRIMMVGLKEL